MLEKGTFCGFKKVGGAQWFWPPLVWDCLNFCDALDYILKLAVYTYNLSTFSFFFGGEFRFLKVK